MLFVRVTCSPSLLAINPVLLWGSIDLGERNVVVYVSVSRPFGSIIGLTKLRNLFFSVSLIRRDDLSSIHGCCRLDITGKFISIPTTLRFRFSHDI